VTGLKVCLVAAESGSSVWRLGSLDEDTFSRESSWNRKKLV